MPTEPTSNNEHIELKKIYLLLDHDNIREYKTDELQILLRHLADHSCSVHPVATTADIHIRVYGGWYEGRQTTDRRFSAAEHYQKYCPAVFRHNDTWYRTAFEFADNLILSPETTRRFGQVRIQETVRIRRTPDPIFRIAPHSACGESDCELQHIRRWARSARACTRKACPKSFDEHFGRREQKQVDVHLVVDALQLAETLSPNSILWIVSDDLDVLPAAVACAERTHIHGQFGLARSTESITYLDDTIRMLGGLIADVSTTNWSL